MKPSRKPLELRALLFPLLLVLPPAAGMAAETYDRYYDYDGLTARLRALADRYPRLARLSSAGESVEGRQLWVMRVTADPGGDAPGKPKFKYVGNMHGDETVSRQVLVYLVDHLLTRYGEDPRVTRLVDTTDVYVMPSMNPDGFERSKEGDCLGKTGGRANGRGVDLNRSFPDQYGGTSATDPEDAPEVTAVMRWIQENKWVHLPSGAVPDQTQT